MNAHDFQATKIRIKRLAFTILIAYAAVCAVLFFLQRTLMYFPDRTAFVPEEWGLRELHPVGLTTRDGLKITGWYSPATSREKQTIIFTQGNAGHVGYRNYKVRPWIERGYGVFMVGYRGFSENPGTPTEQGIYNDARAAMDFLKDKGVTGQAIVLYGESLGTGVAVQMATEYPVAGLILESPYTSTREVAEHRYPFLPVGLILKDVYDSYAKIKDVHAPLLILHGEADVVIPVQFGRKLLDAAHEPKEGVFIPGLGHNTIYDLRAREAVLRFLEKLPTDELLNQAHALP